MRTDDLDADAVHPLQRLAPGHERRKKEVAEGAVVEEQRSQRVALDGDVAKGLGDRRCQKDRLPGEEVHLAEKLRWAVPDDLVACGVENRHFALEDRDQGVAPVADAVQDVADLRGSLLAVLGERRQLGFGQHRTGRSFHCIELSHCARVYRRGGSACSRLAGRATELSGCGCLKIP